MTEVNPFTTVSTWPTIADVIVDGQELDNLTLAEVKANPNAIIAETTTYSYGLTVYLYRDASFQSWKDTMISEADHPTEAEKTLRDTYSNYSLAIKCDIFNLVGNTNTAIRAQTGCCLRDMDTTKGGGYCMLINSAEDGIDTLNNLE